MQISFESFLIDISRCFLQRDLRLWRSRLILPFSIITKHGPILLETESAVERNFGLYLKAMDAMGLDLVDRHALSLEDCEDDTWLGTFRTRLVRNNNLATPPYTSTALLRLCDGRLRMSSMLNGRGHYDWTGISDA